MDLKKSGGGTDGGGPPLGGDGFGVASLQVNHLSDDDFRKLYQILNRIHMYVISIACRDKKLFVFEDWSFSLFFAFLSEISTEILHRILGRKYGKIEVKNQSEPLSLYIPPLIFGGFKKC